MNFNPKYLPAPWSRWRPKVDHVRNNIYQYACFIKIELRRFDLSCAQNHTGSRVQTKTIFYDQVAGNNNNNNNWCRSWVDE